MTDRTSPDVDLATEAANRKGLPIDTRSWLESSAHRHWLKSRVFSLLAFAQRTYAVGGGFFVVDGEGRPLPGQRIQLLQTARLAYAGSVGASLGVPGGLPLVDHALHSLLGPFSDRTHGGWYSSLGAKRGRKLVYDHVYVALAAAAAKAIDHPQADFLLEAVGGVLLEHFWEESRGSFRESFAIDWSDEERYRGANSNMHGTEALLALGDVTGDGAWHHRANRIADRIINQSARGADWLLLEHFDPDWEPLVQYNINEPGHPFRPPGVCPGHLFEWSRLLVHLYCSPHVGAEPWQLEAAVSLAKRGLQFWSGDAREGLAYTVRPDGTAISDIRLHWPVCEALQACAVLAKYLNDYTWEWWYSELWNHAARRFMSPDGTWIPEFDADWNAGTSIWAGRADFYHVMGAYVTPLLPAERSILGSLARQRDVSGGEVSEHSVPIS